MVFTLQTRLRCKTSAPAVLARRRPFCFAPHSDIVRSVMTFAASLNISLLSLFHLSFGRFLTALQSGAPFASLQCKICGAITRWNLIRQSWLNRSETTVCYAHAWRPLWHLDVPVCSLCGFSCGRRQRLLFFSCLFNMLNAVFLPRRIYRFNVMLDSE